GVTKVIFKSNDGSPMAGKVKVGFGEDNRPQILEITNPVDSVVVDAPEGGFVPGTNYFAAMLPQIHAEGITIILRTQDKKATRVLENAVTVNRSSFGVLDDVDSRLEYIDDEVQPGTNPDDFIQFEDPIAKYACVEKFDTNGDGEVSYAEAAAATLLKGLFNNWQAVTHFDEIKYFTGVRTTDGVFSGLANLESIIIPDFITTIGNFKNCISLQSVILPTQLKTLPKECFYGCSALREVTLPSTITTIPNYCFYDCSALESVDIPSSVSSLGTCSFSGCRSLIYIELPSELSRIDDSAFAGCKSIVSISIPSSVTSMGTSVFSGCSSLESVVLPSRIASLPNGTFCCCSNLSSVTWPTTMTSIGADSFSCGSDNISYQYAYEECNFRNNNYTLELPQSVTTIGKNAFNGIHHLIIPSTSFVSISDNSFGSTARYRTYLYVPSSLIEMYKSNSIWQNYKDRIFSLEDYPVAGIEARGKIGEPVDLGLSVKWASWNIGASNPEEYGNYFAWGATDTEWHNYYYWSSYELCLGKYSLLTKYNNYGNYGLVDGKTVLEPIDDAATSNWGSNWRIPTIQEWNELMNSNNCIWEWTTLNGVYGRKVTSRKENHTDKWIFLPAAGLRYDKNGSSIGTFGYYWSSSLYTAEGPPRNPLNAYNIRLYDCGFNSENQIRYSGLTIRPVCD
ncbi:MAG: leucine-rich repeat protein, partial [Bacteroidales bacterium]|nr:leucine-rich repeat protein [Bacteroidales bacterium]